VSFFPFIIITMKVSFTTVLLLCATSTVSGFVSSRPTFATRTSAPSSTVRFVSKEEDLELTRKVIHDFIGSDGDEEPAPEPKKEAPKEKVAAAAPAPATEE